MKQHRESADAFAKAVKMAQGLGDKRSVFRNYRDGMNTLKRVKPLPAKELYDASEALLTWQPEQWSLDEINTIMTYSIEGLVAHKNIESR